MSGESEKLMSKYQNKPKVTSLDIDSMRLQEIKDIICNKDVLYEEKIRDMK